MSNKTYFPTDTDTDTADTRLLCLMYKRSLTPELYQQIVNTSSSRSYDKIKIDTSRPNLVERFKSFLLYKGGMLDTTMPKQISVIGISQAIFNNSLRSGL